MEIDKRAAEKAVWVMTNQSLSDAAKYKFISDLIPGELGDASARVKLVEQIQDEILETLVGLQDRITWLIKHTKESCDAS